MDEPAHRCSDEQTKCVSNTIALVGWRAWHLVGGDGTTRVHGDEIGERATDVYAD